MISDQQPFCLPELRPELQLLEGATDVNGQPTWMVHDPLRNRFVQIDIAVYEVMRHWRDRGTFEDLITRVNAGKRVTLDDANLASLIEFLHASNLTTEPKSQGWRHFAREYEAGRHSIAGFLIHNYLFLRLPLCRPQAFLERTVPYAQALWTPAARAVVIGMGIVGLYLVSRQWEEYLGTLDVFFGWEGAVLIALALVLVKAAHELGHAYTAVGFGCRVHTMGVAFVVMAPLLYTDVTDAWRLKERRKRLRIDSAGIRVELAIAAVALFAWAFLPTGPLRSLAFAVSAVSIASSLAVNLNPFMRFDGYYLMSEMLGVENLQSRAFALGRWRLRELLFGLGMPPPEDLPRRLTTFLILYAWATWIYRLVLFVGIALLVYHYFFKLLGILLFALEIIYFVAGPIYGELKVWLKLRRQIFVSRRTAQAAVCAAAVLVMCLVPWSTRVEIPAVVESERLQAVFPIKAARIETRHVRHGDIVRAGDLLLTLSSPDIEQEIERSRISLRLARLQYSRRIADPMDRESSLILESTISALLAKLEGLKQELAELKIVAPFDGRIVQIDPDLTPGRWVSPRDQIAVISGGTSTVAKGYVAESDVWRIAERTKALFVPDHPMRGSIPVVVSQIAASGAARIEIADLASTNGGRIAVTLDERRNAVPANAQYLVHFSGESPQPGLELSVRGVVLAEGHAESVFARLWRQILKVMVREIGF